MKRSIRAWAASIGVVLMAAGGVALLAAAPAQAAVEPNQLTFNPPTGTDKLAPTVLTVGPCPTTADGYRATVTGPGVFQPGLGVALIIIGGSFVLGTMRFDRPRPARW